MITGNDSWKFLIWALVVLAIMGASGGIAIAFGGAGRFFGAANILLAIWFIFSKHQKLKDK